eukprot:351771-Chlamydomonas_euryale.AAC.4
MVAGTMAKTVEEEMHSQRFLRLGWSGLLETAVSPMRQRLACKDCHVGDYGDVAGAGHVGDYGDVAGTGHVGDYEVSPMPQMFMFGSRSTARCKQILGERRRGAQGALKSTTQANIAGQGRTRRKQILRGQGRGVEGALKRTTQAKGKGRDIGDSAEPDAGNDSLIGEDGKRNAGVVTMHSKGKVYERAPKPFRGPPS